MPRQQLVCNIPTPATNRAQGSGVGNSYDAAWDEAKANALALAWSEALQAAFNMRCPPDCLLKQFGMNLTAPTDPHPVRNPANRHQWVATSEVTWTIVVQCVGGEATRPQITWDPGNPGKPRKLPCGEEVAFRDTTQANSLSLDGQVAERTAIALAEDNAYLALLKLISQIRCPSRCSRMSVSISVGPPRGCGSRRDSGVGLNEYWKGTGECPWLVIVVCKAEDH
jgi:hypothetical protein